MEQLLLIPFLQSMWVVALYAGAVAAGVVIDDIAVLGDILLQIKDKTKNDQSRNNRLEDNVHPRVSIAMLWRRFFISVGIALLLGMGAIVSPVFAPVIIGTLSLSAGLYFANASINEIGQSIKEYRRLMRQHQPLARMGLHLIGLIPGKRCLVRQLARKVHLHSSVEPPCKDSDEDIVHAIEKESARKDWGLTFQSALVVSALVLDHPAFVGIISHASAMGFAGTFMVMLLPLAAASFVTWTLATIGVLGIIKTDNVGGWFNEIGDSLSKRFPFLQPLMQRLAFIKRWMEQSSVIRAAEKAIKHLGRNLGYYLWPISISLLSFVSGELITHGWHHLLASTPQMVQAMPALAPVVGPLTRAAQTLAHLTHFTHTAAFASPALVMLAHLLSVLLAHPIVVGLALGLIVKAGMTLVKKVVQKPQPVSTGTTQTTQQKQVQATAPQPVKVTPPATVEAPPITTPVARAAIAAAPAATASATGAPVITSDDEREQAVAADEQSRKDEDEAKAISAREALDLAWAELWHDLFGSHEHPVRHDPHSELATNVDPND